MCENCHSKNTQLLKPCAIYTVYKDNRPVKEVNLSDRKPEIYCSDCGWVTVIGEL